MPRRKSPRKNAKVAEESKRTTGAEKPESYDDPEDHVQVYYRQSPTTGRVTLHLRKPEDSPEEPSGSSRSAQKRKSTESPKKAQEPLLGAQGQSDRKRPRRGTSQAAQLMNEEYSDSPQDAQGNTGAGTQGHGTSTDNESTESEEGEVVQQQIHPPQVAELNICEKLTLWLFGLPNEDEPSPVYQFLERIVNLVPENSLTRRLMWTFMGIIIFILAGLSIYEIYKAVVPKVHWS